MKNRIVGLLPMKAHSERVAGKNFRLFNRKPLFRWILDALCSVESIDQVVINTDARFLLAENDLTDSKRVRIRDRPAELCGAASRPASSSEARMLRMVAGLTSSPACRARVCEPTGAPV